MHFTYLAPKDGQEDLQQGDVLSVTPALSDIIREFHPRYIKPDYTHFLITTQSCDLVRRAGDGCSAGYISVCAIRPLSVVLEREIQRYQDKPLLTQIGAVDSRNREKLRQFLERLTNNNNHEYFYLHADQTAGLKDNSCAFLRLHVALRSRESYEILKNSRIIRLSPTFQAKLGWLVGNVYSRVGTDDWIPEHYSKREWQEIIKSILDGATNWVDNSRIQALQKKFPADQISQLTSDQISEELDKVEIEQPKDALINLVVSELQRRSFLSEDATEKARLALKNAPALASFIKT